MEPYITITLLCLLVNAFTAVLLAHRRNDRLRLDNAALSRQLGEAWRRIGGLQARQKPGRHTTRGVSGRFVK